MSIVNWLPIILIFCFVGIALFTILGMEFKYGKTIMVVLVCIVAIIMVSSVSLAIYSCHKETRTSEVTKVGNNEDGTAIWLRDGTVHNVNYRAASAYPVGSNYTYVKNVCK